MNSISALMKLRSLFIALLIACPPLSHAAAEQTPTKTSVVSKIIGGHPGTGRAAWRQVYDEHLPEPRVECIAAQGVVYCTTQTSISAWSAQTGQIIWKKDLTNIVGATNTPDHPHIPAPSISGDNVYVSVSLMNHGILLALDRTNGTEKWRYTTAEIGAKTQPALYSSVATASGSILSSPVVWRNLVIARTGAQLSAFNISNGMLVWTSPFTDPILPLVPPSSQPIVSANALYFSCDDGLARAIDPQTGRTIWKDNVTEGGVDTPIFRKIVVVLGFCAPVLNGDTLYTADGAGNVYAMQAGDGRILWKAHFDHVRHLAMWPGGLLVGTDTSLAELNPVTGSLLHSYSTDGGAAYFTVANKLAVIAHSPFKSRGWEIVDLSNWRQLWLDNSFSVYSNPVIDNSKIILAGRLFQSPSTAQNSEIRVYARTKS